MNAEAKPSADLIEIIVAFRRPKSHAHMQRIAARVVERLQRDMNTRFPVQRPMVYLSDVRGEDDE